MFTSIRSAATVDIAARMAKNTAVVTSPRRRVQSAVSTATAAPASCGK
ncbi:MAG: hypothetical protein U0325_20435 [Polyangiales bacterium]